MKHSRLFAAMVMVAIIVLAGCSGKFGTTATKGSPDAVEHNDAFSSVIVTSDFGNRLHLQEDIVINPKTSALEGLQRTTDVDTKYGGGFIDDISNIRDQHDGNDLDWFIYINGIQSKSGAGSYTLKSGDIQRWDLHDWSYRQFTPAIIGDFPEPFVHGYNGKIWPTLVVYQEAFQTEASDIVANLSQFGVQDISARNTNRLTNDERKSSNLILLGDMNSPLISELNKIWERIGFFARFDDGKLVILDSRGKTSTEYGSSTGLIQATQSPWNSKGLGVCENVVWMITGTDDEGVKDAINAILNQSNDIQHLFAAVIVQEEVVGIPIASP